MRSHHYLSGLGVAVLFWSQFAFCLTNSQLALEVSAESSARVALYYQLSPISGEKIDFPLTINNLSRKFERESELFYAVGNVEQAEIFFIDNRFELTPAIGFGQSIFLQGVFEFNDTNKPANQPLRIPVLKNPVKGNQTNGVRVKFSSEYAIDRYGQGNYSNTFTLIVRPVI